MNDTKHINCICAGTFFLVACLLYFFVYRDIFFLVHDSAIEILQVRDFLPWPLSTFIYAYPNVAPIESFYGYFMKPFMWILGEGIETFQIVFGMVFGITVALFFVLLRRVFSLPVAILITMAYVTSAYTIRWPLLLLRVGFSPLLTICVMLGLLDLYQNKTKRGCFLVVLSSFLAFNTYSSFKAVIPGLLGAAFIGGVFLPDGRPYLKRVSVAGGLFLLLASAFWILSLSKDSHTSEAWSLVFRGNYMYEITDLYKDKSFFTYLTFFIRSFFLPVYENPQGFLADPTHYLFGRPMLSVWLYFFWGVGLVTVVLKTYKKKELVAFICFVTIILSSSILCFGGPSLKTHLALAPVEFLIIAYGLNEILKVCRFNKVVITLFALFFVWVGFLEAKFMINEVSLRSKSTLSFVHAEIGSYLTRHDKDFDFAFSSVGNEMLRANYTRWRSKTKYIEDSEKLNYSLYEIYLTPPEVAVPMTVYRKKSENDRIYVIVPKNSVVGAQMSADPNFCFISYLYEGLNLQVALFSSCKK